MASGESVVEPCGPTNAEIAAWLERAGELYEAQGENPFRVRAYRGAADTLRQLPGSISQLLREQGFDALTEITGIGRGIAGAIAEIVRTGRLRRVERLQGEICPERLFASVPGVGPVLARRIHEQLGIASLEELERAAHDGRFSSLPGVGPRRSAALREILATRLRHRTPGAGRFGPAPVERPTVAELLDVDARYRAAAQRDELPKIAPRRFNPERERWLPVLHTDWGDFHYTVLFSNTAAAHRLGTTHDWVVLFYGRDHQDEGQATVVTERHGPLRGRRVVRGREVECRRHYESLSAGAARPSSRDAAPAPATAPR